MYHNLSFQLTLADIAIYGTLDLIPDGVSLENWPRLAENKKTVESLPKLKAYIAKRQ